MKSRFGVYNVENVPDAIDLDPRERRVSVAGDWHGNIQWIAKAIPAITSESPDIRTILHLGDFGIADSPPGRTHLESVDNWCERAGIERILVTPGNHEDWDKLDRDFEEVPGEPIQVSATVTVLPRGFRFFLGGRPFMSFGGAASIDYQQRRSGFDWFPTEAPTDEDVARAISGGPVDVLLMHETIDGGTEESELKVNRNPSVWPAEALHYSALSRERATRVWSEVEPLVLLHGHMHVSDERTFDDGRRVVSLGRDNQERNLGILDLDDLTWSWLAGPPQQAHARRTLNVESQYLTRPGDSEAVEDNWR